MINLQEFEKLVEQIREFNQLAFTDAERNTPEYLDHCKAMVTEESKTERDEALTPIQELDSLADTIVVTVQASDAPNMDDSYLFNCYMLIGEAVMLASRKGYDLYGATCAVNINNLSKFPLLSEVREVYGDDWESAACNWVEDQGRYTGVKAQVVKDSHGDTRVVFKSDTGKVVKWFGYKDVDLSSYITDNTTTNNEEVNIND